MREKVRKKLRLPEEAVEMSYKLQDVPVQTHKGIKH